jgi:hypothetical protein
MNHNPQGGKQIPRFHESDCFREEQENTGNRPVGAKSNRADSEGRLSGREPGNALIRKGAKSPEGERNPGIGWERLFGADETGRLS